MIRLDKFLADRKVGTRSEVKNYIKKGLVSIDGQIIKNADYKFDPDVCLVSFQGKELSYEEYSFYMLNKPAGVITASMNPKEPTVMDFFADEPSPDLAPVGRLDKDTVGLLLITNHGQLAHRMLAPKSHVDKVYYAGLKKPLCTEQAKRIEEGVDIGEEKLTDPAKCEILTDERFAGCARLTIHEGKFHQVKRMFEAVDNEVVYLKRENFGPLILDDNLKEGEYRKCTNMEVEELLKLLL